MPPGAMVTFWKLRELACDFHRRRALKLLHRNMHDVFTNLIDQRRKQRSARPIRRDHRLEIRNIVVRTTCGKGSTREHRANPIFIETARADEMKGFDQDALLLETLGVGRHRARRLSTEVCMVPATRDEEARGGRSGQEDWSHNRHVGQM